MNDDLKWVQFYFCVLNGICVWWVFFGCVLLEWIMRRELVCLWWCDNGVGILVVVFWIVYVVFLGGELLGSVVWIQSVRVKCLVSVFGRCIELVWCLLQVLLDRCSLCLWLRFFRWVLRKLYRLLLKCMVLIGVWIWLFFIQKVVKWVILVRCVVGMFEQFRYYRLLMYRLVFRVSRICVCFRLLLVMFSVVGVLLVLVLLVIRLYLWVLCEFIRCLFRWLLLISLILVCGEFFVLNVGEGEVVGCLVRFSSGLSRVLLFCRCCRGFLLVVRVCVEKLFQQSICMIFLSVVGVRQV